MAAYLLPCSCGKTVLVEMGQAGGRVTCSCGTQLEVPTLRQLRHLPQQQAVGQPRAASNWGTRQGWIAASLIAIVILVGWSAWSWWREPSQPKFVAADYMEIIDKHLKDMKPAEAWNRWIEYYRPLADRGLPVFQAGNAAQIEGTIAHERFLRRMLLTIAGIFAAAAAAGVFWPEPQRVPTSRK